MLHPNPPHHPHQTGGPENVGLADRWISGALGASILFKGLRRGGLGGILRTAVGSCLLYRGLTGHCPVQQSIEESHARKPGSAPAPVETFAATWKKKPYHVRRPSQEPPDQVQEASEESFPASDPPSWTSDRT